MRSERDLEGVLALIDTPYRANTSLDNPRTPGADTDPVQHASPEASNPSPEASNPSPEAVSPESSTDRRTPSGMEVDVPSTQEESTTSLVDPSSSQ